eukprot:CAMPEP_0194556506 /NCGR_PEP_ID=MMETSP0253-20130528/98780_1 /TAXON_ID=2966 /ORGANISM="Noctiluca scintillans" /LENGTH=133 /DNA_ID=CAMNT_0039404011 /DNA_START=480 /DNA_END=881 /DNA_ORIENTATION=+
MHGRMVTPGANGAVCGHPPPPGNLALSQRGSAALSIEAALSLEVHLVSGQERMLSVDTLRDNGHVVASKETPRTTSTPTASANFVSVILVTSETTDSPNSSLQNSSLRSVSSSVFTSSFALTSFSSLHFGTRK